MLFYSPWLSLEPYPEVPLTHYLSRSAERFAGKTAFISADGCAFTYAQTWEAARRLGRFLQDQGIAPGDRRHRHRRRLAAYRRYRSMR